MLFVPSELLKVIISFWGSAIKVMDNAASEITEAAPKTNEKTTAGKID